MGYWLLDMGYGIWAIGYWLLVIGYWLCDMGGKAAYPCLYTLHPTLYTISASAPASNLSPLAISPHLPAFWQCFDAATKQMQQRYIVSRVKTDVVFGRTLILRRTMNGSKNNVIRPKGDKFGEWFGEHLK